MEDSEKTNDSMLLEEAMEETEKSTQETNATEEDNAEDGADDGMGMVQDSELVGGVLDNEDIEMADGVAEDSENNNLAPEDSMDAAAAILEGEDGSGEVSQEALSTPEGFLGDQFISPADSMIVQSEPPQQLMEEADAPGEDEDDIALENEGETEGDEVIKSEADTTDEPSSKTEDGEQSEGVEEDMSMQETEGEAGELKEQDESSTVGLGTLSDGMSLEILPDQEDHEAGDDSQEEKDADKTTCDPAGNTDDTIQLHLDESEEGDENEGTGETGGITLLAGEDQLEGALSELEGKIAAASEKGVHLLAGQENLQGMQLMEGDDKPEGEIDATETAAQQEIQAQLNAALLKQEEMKTEDDSDSGAFSESQPNTVSDALSTLASAALDHQAPPTNGVKSEIDESQIKTETDSTEPQWMDVGICKGTHCQVRSFFIPKSGQSWDQNWEGITTSTLPDHRGLAKLELESGKAYKFRVAAINSCGRGPWSEVAAFKTSLPGFPGAPSAIKIAKTADGAHLSWEPPPITSGVIEDYHVYLAVRTATTTDTSRVVSSSANQLAFVRIYQGAANQCSVGNETLGKAHIDMTTKPAILFRISARNEKGIGPATQVRWLQEVGAPNNAARPAQAPRRPATENKPHGNYKRKKSESQ